MNVLDDILTGVVADLRAREAAVDLAEVKKRAAKAPDARDALAVLRGREGAVSIIGEIKRATPVIGPLAKIENPAAYASAYEAGGATAVSVFTESRYFRGSFADLDAVRAAVDVPVLCKDFILTSYQIHEARAHGADMVLLLAQVLEHPALVALLERTHSLGMHAVVEVHSRLEALRALEAGAQIIGVNAYDLKTMSIERAVIDQIIDVIPSSVITVAESGVRTPHDVFEYAKSGADAVLVGEALVTSADPQATLSDMVSAGSHPALRTNRKERVRAALDISEAEDLAPRDIRAQQDPSDS